MSNNLIYIFSYQSACALPIPSIAKSVFDSRSTTHTPTQASGTVTFYLEGNGGKEQEIQKNISLEPKLNQCHNRDLDSGHRLPYASTECRAQTGIDIPLFFYEFILSLCYAGGSLTSGAKVTSSKAGVGSYHSCVLLRSCPFSPVGYLLHSYSVILRLPVQSLQKGFMP